MLRNIVLELGNDEFIDIQFLFYDITMLLIKEMNLTCLQAAYMTEELGQSRGEV
jgi:hypothetical protein